MELQDVQGPGYGPYPKDTFGNVWNRTASTVALGDLVMLDMGNVDTANPNTSTSLGALTSPYSNAILPATIGVGGLLGVTTVPGYFFGIVVNLLDGAGADDTLVRVQFQGVVRASLTATAATTGLALVGANGVKTLTAATAAGKKTLGIAWEPNASAAGVFKIMFDGINGFGPGNLTS